MAEIWLARQTGLAGFNRFVVIKKILSHLAEEDTFVKMFLDEARMSSQLSHPNIVQVYDLGEADTTYFIAMEYIAGENLAAIAWRGVKRKSPISPPFAARVVADACKALHYAHHLKGSDGKPLEIVHRDISPQNILVTYEGEVKVVDFGIAKAATKSQHTKTGMLKGKFSYMSPEQCLGQNVDMRSDIFALGIVLYELCTGKRLFKHESELMILEMITKRRITPPSDVADNIAPGLEDIILTALDKDMGARFQTGQDMQIALEDYLRAEELPSSNADLSTFMRDLFSDKMEEKRKLVEIASKDEFLEQYAEDESTDSFTGQANNSSGGRPNTTDKRRVVYGRPSDIRVSGVVPAGQHTAQGQMVGHPQLTGPGQMPGHPMGTPIGSMPPGYNVGQMGAYPQSHPMYFQSQSHPGQPYTQSSNWGPGIIIAIALLVIVLATVYLAYELIPTEAEPIPEVLPARIGHIELDSVPDGATIWVDGKPVKLESGDVAKTPIEQLTPLEFGRTYKIQIIKKGYKPFAKTIQMGEALHDQLIKPTLTPLPTKLNVALAGGGPKQVNLLIDGKDKGTGNRITVAVDPGEVTVAATADGFECKATPEQLQVEAGTTREVTIRCAKPTPQPKIRTTVRPTSTERRPTPHVVRGDCAPDPGAPPGYITISTKPYSEIWHNGRKLGETPLNKFKLPSGCIRLKAIHPGPPTREKVFNVNIPPNATETYRTTIP